MKFFFFFNLSKALGCLPTQISCFKMVFNRPGLPLGGDTEGDD
jgi:hypothetical protein